MEPDALLGSAALERAHQGDDPAAAVFGAALVPSELGGYTRKNIRFAARVIARPLADEAQGPAPEDPMDFAQSMSSVGASVTSPAKLAFVGYVVLAYHRDITTSAWQFLLV